MPQEHIARIDRVLARIANGRKQVEATIQKQQKRLAENAQVIAQAREVLERPIR
jgi:hypothetical protein